jgi:hypothetical protein
MLPRTPERWTEAVLVCAVVGLSLYSLLMCLCVGPRPTVSVVAADAFSRHPILAFALGVLVGHWLWPVR